MKLNEDFVRGAKLHPGWMIAFILWLAGVIAAPGMFSIIVGLLWFIPVLLTCKSVGRANKP